MLSEKKSQSKEAMSCVIPSIEQPSGHDRIIKMKDRLVGVSGLGAYCKRVP